MNCSQCGIPVRGEDSVPLSRGFVLCQRCDYSLDTIATAVRQTTGVSEAASFRDAAAMWSKATAVQFVRKPIKTVTRFEVRFWLYGMAHSAFGGRFYL